MSGDHRTSQIEAAAAIWAKGVPSPPAILVDLENGTALQFSGPAAELLRRDAYCDFLAPSHQEPDVND